jgi:hypothetical protein
MAHLAKATLAAPAEEATIRFTIREVDDNGRAQISISHLLASELEGDATDKLDLLRARISLAASAFTKYRLYKETDKGLPREVPLVAGSTSMASERVQVSTEQSAPMRVRIGGGAEGTAPLSDLMLEILVPLYNGEPYVAQVTADLTISTGWKAAVVRVNGQAVADSSDPLIDQLPHEKKSPSASAAKKRAPAKKTKKTAKAMKDKKKKKAGKSQKKDKKKAGKSGKAAKRAKKKNARKSPQQLLNELLASAHQQQQ